MNEINELKIQAENSNLQINKNEFEKSQLNNKINELNNILTKKEEIIKIKENELKNLNNKNNEYEKSLITKLIPKKEAKENA